MAPFTRSKSKKDRAAKAAKKTAKGATKAAKGVAIVQVAKRTPKRWIPIVGAALAALVATKIVRGRHSDPAAV
jgi:hypothetical protein